ncbi:MAG TPA: tRNA dihydrouridine synthase DusB [Candidatus Peregrinibacteria bacterium]|nr:tRNA dihydrouridine synthase DusB [Candidatus Peregrinibacteria bacterium]
MTTDFYEPIKMKFSWSKYKKPILVLAPMAGYTDSAFRQVVKSLAPEVITMTELISVNAIHYGTEKTMEMLHFNSKEQPLILQLFGNNPEYFVEAAKLGEKLGFAGIDINMGCPVRKVTKNGYGSALLRTPDLACEIVQKVSEATKLPISVKTRLGWSKKEEILELAEKLEKAGTKALLIHGRTYQQGFGGEADWEPIYAVKKKVKIPVLGNGDIKSLQDFREKINNLDGVLVGRGTVGNPWLMKELQEGKPVQLSFSEKIPLISKHCKITVKNLGEERGVREVRKHLFAYAKGFAGAVDLRKKIITTNTLAKIQKELVIHK